MKRTRISTNFDNDSYIYLEMSTTMKFYCFFALYRRSRTNLAWLPEWQLWTTLEICINRLSVKALAGPCQTEPMVVTEVGRQRMMVFGTGFYSLIKSEVNELYSR